MKDIRGSRCGPILDGESGEKHNAIFRNFVDCFQKEFVEHVSKDLRIPKWAIMGTAPNGKAGE